MKNGFLDRFFFFWRSTEKKFFRTFFLGKHLHLCPWSLALASSIPILGLGLGFFLSPWPWPRALCPRLHLWQQRTKWYHISSTEFQRYSHNHFYWLRRKNMHDAIKVDYYVLWFKTSDWRQVIAAVDRGKPAVCCSSKNGIKSTNMRVQEKHKKLGNSLTNREKYRICYRIKIKRELNLCCLKRHILDFFYIVKNLDLFFILKQKFYKMSILHIFPTFPTLLSIVLWIRVLLLIFVTYLNTQLSTKPIHLICKFKDEEVA